MKGNSETITDYQQGFKIDELFIVHTMARGITLNNEQPGFSKSPNHHFKYGYSAFDDRYVSGEDHTSGQPNLFLIAAADVIKPGFSPVFMSRLLVDTHFFAGKPKVPPYLFPLYILPDKGPAELNFQAEIIKQIAGNLYLSFTHEMEPRQEGEVCFANSRNIRPEFRLTFAPLDVLDYLYAVLHVAAYRKKYNPHKKRDFPRIPYPLEANNFWHLVDLGSRLRHLHLLEISAGEKDHIKYPLAGNHLISKIWFETYASPPEVPDEKGVFPYPDYLGAVYINDSQYFAEVPTSAWEMYIGGYQPAQKWLNDRKGRELNPEDIMHYQKMIVALAETSRIIKEINKIEMDM